MWYNCLLVVEDENHYNENNTIEHWKTGFNTEIYNLNLKTQFRLMNEKVSLSLNV